MVIENPQIERVTGYLTRLQLVATRDRLEAVLQQAAKGEVPTLTSLTVCWGRKSHPRTRSE